MSKPLRKIYGYSLAAVAAGIILGVIATLTGHPVLFFASGLFFGMGGTSWIVAEEMRRFEKLNGATAGEMIKQIAEVLPNDRYCIECDHVHPEGLGHREYSEKLQRRVYLPEGQPLTPLGKDPADGACTFAEDVTR